MGDKEATFIGSNEWIGAFEISYIISNLIGKDCKIIHINNGTEIVTIVKEFQEHFEKEGTPIMIGGGVYAYTMLGINYN